MPGITTHQQPVHLTRAAIDRRLRDPRRGGAEPWAVSLGRAIARERRRRGLSQECLAAALGCDRSAVSRWEAGHRLPTLTRLLRLGQELGCGAPALVAAMEMQEMQEEHDAASHRR